MFQAQLDEIDSPLLIITVWLANALIAKKKRQLYAYSRKGGYMISGFLAWYIQMSWSSPIVNRVNVVNVVCYFVVNCFPSKFLCS